MHRFKAYWFKLKRAFVYHVIYWCGRIGGWALLQRLELEGYPNPERGRDFIRRSIGYIGDDVTHYLLHNNSELEILSTRLARRYDPSMAYNEAIERSIAAKKNARELIVGMTDFQKTSFRVQQQEQLKNLRRA